MSKYEIVDTDIPGLLDKWYKRIRESQFSHFQAENHYAKLHFRIGCAATISTIVVGSSFFGAYEMNPGHQMKLILGLFSLVAIILTGLQTFLDYSDRAKKHQIAATGYGALRRKIEQLKTYLATDTVSFELADEINNLREKIDALSGDAPNIPHSIWKKAKKVMDEEAKR